MDSPVRKKLIDELARLYRAHSAVQSLLDAAGIRSQALIAWSDRPRDTWTAILSHLEVQEQVQALLDVVIDDYPQNGISTRPGSRRCCSQRGEQGSPIFPTIRSWHPAPPRR